MNLLLPDSGLIFWMTIIFALVFFVLAKFGFPVITGMVEKRRMRIDDAIEAARKAEDAIAHLNQEQERIVAETRAEQARLKKEAASERDRMIAQAREQARIEAQKIMDEAKARIAEEKEDALRDMRREVAMLSLAVAEHVVRKNLESDADQRLLVDKLVDEMSASNGERKITSES
ncbi:MAG: F0F1 ATP synthase subunit B [Bacteroidales bacterium]|nr:F0F1 ATP synthase subunit B [Bacteroidales bacterium]